MTQQTVNEMLDELEASFDSVIVDIKTLFSLADAQLSHAEVLPDGGFASFTSGVEGLLDDVRFSVTLIRKRLNLPPAPVTLQVDNAA